MSWLCIINAHCHASLPSLHIASFLRNESDMHLESTYKQKNFLIPLLENFYL
ncbi:protein of unknown function [Serratia sp. Tan611]|nr:protein of unknown function [Serratia sp. Tan611]